MSVHRDRPEVAVVKAHSEVDVGSRAAQTNTDIIFALVAQLSLDPFDQGLPTLYILTHPQHDTKLCQAMWQLAIGTGIHIVEE